MEEGVHLPSEEPEEKGWARQPGQGSWGRRGHLEIVSRETPNTTDDKPQAMRLVNGRWARSEPCPEVKLSVQAKEASQGEKQRARHETEYLRELPWHDSGGSDYKKGPKGHVISEKPSRKTGQKS